MFKKLTIYLQLFHRLRHLQLLFLLELYTTLKCMHLNIDRPHVLKIRRETFFRQRLAAKK